MKIQSFILGFLLLFSTCLHAQNITTEQRTVRGYGATEQAAVSDALIQAVGQLKGVSIDSEQISSSLSRESSSAEGETFNSQSATQQLLKKKTKGQLAGYEVTDISASDSGYRAEVDVTFHHYKEQGYSADRRRKLAVVPFTTSKKYFSLLGDRTASSKVEAELRTQLIDLFTQSRRLAVLDRQHGEAYEAEKAIWLSPDSQNKEQARLGQVRGVDYLVVGTIRSMRSKRSVEHIQLTNEDVSTYSGKAQVEYKIIQAATRQIKWADSVTKTYSDREIRRMLAKFGSSQTGMINDMANSIVQMAMANIYPMRVVSVKGKTIILNQGGKSLHKGELLDIFFVGEEMIDPYTKESLGQMEEKIATVKVIRPTAKVTYTKVIKGDAELIDKGAIARRQ